jgi:hypothetical protein
VRQAGLAAVFLLAVLMVASVHAQAPPPAGEGFRADAGPDFLGRRGPAITGWLYNDRHVPITNVRVRVDVLDGGGQLIGSGEGWVYGGVPAFGRAYFFVPVPRYGAAYRVAVVSFDRLQFE